MKRIRIAGMAVVAILVLSGLTASAQAANGPNWIVKKVNLAMAGVKNIKVTQLGVQTLTGAATITCKALEAEGQAGTAAEKEQNQIMGNEPGEGKAKLVFKECSLNGFASCVVANIKAPVFVLAGYSPGATTMGLAVFFPQVGSTFSEVKFGANCSILSNSTLKIEAAGTEVGLQLPEAGAKRKAGVIVKLGKSDTFALGVSGEENVINALEAPTTALKEAEVSELANTTKKTIKAELKAGVLGTSTQSGLSAIELESKEAFGWIS
jgi:hypothetical protein